MPLSDTTALVRVSRECVSIIVNVLLFITYYYLLNYLLITEPVTVNLHTVGLTEGTIARNVIISLLSIRNIRDTVQVLSILFGLSWLIVMYIIRELKLFAANSNTTTTKLGLRQDLQNLSWRGLLAGIAIILLAPCATTIDASA